MLLIHNLFEILIFYLAQVAHFVEHFCKPAPLRGSARDKPGKLYAQLPRSTYPSEANLDMLGLKGRSMPLDRMKWLYNRYNDETKKADGSAVNESATNKDGGGV